jgi:hypothetical protein
VTGFIECIYCRQSRLLSAFSKVEHVIPQSFGRFENNLTLLRTVCDSCNQFFGDNLDLALARDTVEGQSRVDFGTQQAPQFRTFGKDSRIRAKLLEGPFKNAYVYRAYSPDDGKVSSYPVPQVGFRLKGSGDYLYYVLDELPSKEELTQSGWDEQHPEAIRGLAMSKDALSAALAQRDIPFRFGGDLRGGQSDDDTSALTAQVESTIDSTIQRAVAKIAFNYLTHWEGAEFVRQSTFDTVRDFVRHGRRSSYPLVHVTNAAILHDERDSPERRLGHIITLNWATDGESIVAQLALFNTLKYSVSLARSFGGERRDIDRGSFFNIADRQIVALGRRSSSETET